jgi:hypothetical protein
MLSKFYWVIEICRVDVVKGDDKDDGGVRGGSSLSFVLNAVRNDVLLSRC